MLFRSYKLETGDKTKTVIVSTASPFKFPSKVESSIEINVEDENEFQKIEKLSKLSNLEIPDNIKNLKDKEIIHEHNCNKEDIKEMITEFLLRGENND